jgi:hypothetical protein
MKKCITFMLVAWCIGANLHAQNTTFDALNATAGSNKQINFQALNLYRHRLYTVNFGTVRSDLRFAVSKNSATTFTDVMTITTEGKVGIGTIFQDVVTNTGAIVPADFAQFRLFVKDGIRTEKVKVDIGTGTWGDYVFSPTYKLRPLSEVAQFIQTNQHLPDVPSAKEVEQQGLNLGEMQRLQMIKIEELTLYLLDLKKENDMLREKVEQLEKQLKDEK